MGSLIAICILSVALIILAIAFNQTSKYFMKRIDQLEEEIADFYFWRDMINHRIKNLERKKNETKK